MAIDFPSSPTDQQLFTDPTSGNQFIWYATPGVWKNSNIAYVPRYVTVSQPGYVSSPYTGVSRFYPPTNMTINSVSSSVSNAVSGTDVTYKLFKNGSDTGATYTISVGQNLSTPVSASISLTTSDYLTLNMVTGTAYDLKVFLKYS